MAIAPDPPPPINTIPGFVVYPYPGFIISTDCTLDPISVPSQFTIPSIKVETAVAVPPEDGDYEMATIGEDMYFSPLFVTIIETTAPFTIEVVAVAVDPEETKVRV